MNRLRSPHTRTRTLITGFFFSLRADVSAGWHAIFLGGLGVIFLLLFIFSEDDE